MNFFENYRINVGQEPLTTPFVNEKDIYQDGTTPMYRDVDGKLWAMSGHSHVGHIGMFCGTTLDDLQEVHPISTNFCVGHEDYAFNGIRYPEGVKARGSVWPFGLYICPVTHRFFCFFHNETAWNAKGTGYDALGPCENDLPHYDSDFRHIGLMHYDDEGRNWTFDRWVLTANEVCFTELYNPGAGIAKGQKAGYICFGSADFSIFVEPEGEYIYLFYTMVRADMAKGRQDRCDTYVARTRKRTDGIMGDFVKYYDGAFCEAGNLGKETVIAEHAWHSRVVRLEKYGVYMMTSTYSNYNRDPNEPWEGHTTHLRTSTDLVNWSAPVALKKNGKNFGNTYIAPVSNDGVNQPNVAVGDEITFLLNTNGSNVMRYPSKIIEK